MTVKDVKWSVRHSTSLADKNLVVNPSVPHPFIECFQYTQRTGSTTSELKVNTILVSGLTTGVMT